MFKVRGMCLFLLIFLDFLVYLGLLVCLFEEVAEECELGVERCLVKESSSGMVKLWREMVLSEM